MRFLILIVVTALTLQPEGASAADGHGTNHPAAADLKKFQVAPGLKAELFAGEPLLENPVCFSIDEQGRFYVVETHRYRNAIFDITANTPWLLDDLSFRTVNDRVNFLARTFATNSSVLTNDSELIRLVEDRDGDGRAETSSIFADGFNRPESGTAAGVLAQGTNVWFTSIPDLWRFTNDDLRFTNRTTAGSPSTNPALVNRKSDIVNHLVAGLGVHISVSGHDVHGLIRGHDGRIYFSFGDRGVCVTNREGAVLNVPDTGGVLRCEPDGRNMEIFCIGLRNPQELAFDDYGNLWTVDNDTAGADPCRVLHLVEGGDYGWRGSYQHMKGFGPWVQEELWRGGLDGTLPPAGTVSQGPAGLAFYPGTSRTPQLAGKFVHADFPGGVWAYSVKPRGASFELAQKEKILWNCWPTDVDFGPDGALYVLDWVQGWAPPGKGRIYRLTANEQSPMTKAQLESVWQTQRLLADGMGRRSEKELLALLGQEDRRVRLEAQWELAGRGSAVVPGLLKLATTGKGEVARLHALWALGMYWRLNPPPGRRRSGDASFDQILELTILLKDESAIVRVHAADIVGDLRFLNADLGTKQMMGDPSLVIRGAGVRAQGKILSGFGGQVPVRERISRLQKWKDVVDEVLDNKSRGSSMVHPVGELKKLSADNRAKDPFVIHEITRFYEVDPGGWANLPAGIVYTNHFLNLGTNLPTRLAGLLAYRRLGYGGLTNFISDSNPRLILELARAINDGPVPSGDVVLAGLSDDPRFRDPNWGWSALSNATPAGPFSAKVRPPRDQVLLRALNAHFRLGAVDNAEALARFATGASSVNTDAAVSKAVAPMPASLRAEAVLLLGAWEVLPAKVGDLPIKPSKDPNHGSVPTVNPENWPGWFDRVVGLYRPLPPRSNELARRALTPVIGSLLMDPSTDVLLAALDATVKLNLTNAAPVLLARLRDALTPASVRKMIPAALAALRALELGDAVKLALVDADLTLRASALPYLDQLQGNEAVGILGRIVGQAIQSGSGNSAKGPSGAGETRLGQAALVALGELKDAAADSILHSALTNLIEGTLPATLQLELFEASEKRRDDGTQSLLATYRGSLPKDDGIAAWRETRFGGDAERGRTLFFEKVEVQCSRCHAVKGQGGTVGPALDKIARQRERDYLLEAILLPNKVIAQGFENVTLDLKNGASHAGLVKSEDDQEVRLESPEDGSLRLAKGDIVARRRGLSAMPEGLEQFLSKRDVRDLVEYLATLK